MNNIPKNTRTQLNNLVHFHFEETTVMAGNMHTGEKIALRPVVENLGLNWSGQIQRLKREENFEQLCAYEKYIAEDGKQREMVCMNPVSFQRWLCNLKVSENLNVELWKKYKEELVVQLLLMLKISLDEIQRLRRIEADHKEVCKNLVDYMHYIEEAKELRRLAAEKTKESNQRKEEMLEIISNQNQYKLQLN